jgi:hypothetical protein
MGGPAGAFYLKMADFEATERLGGTVSGAERAVPRLGGTVNGMERAVERQSLTGLGPEGAACTVENLRVLAPAW